MKTTPKDSEKLDRSSLLTEQQNPSSMDLDSKSVAEILEMINMEDSTVAASVRRVLPQVEKAVDLSVNALRDGGHVFYVGAGTSGRLGVLDAAECPPTFSAPSHYFQGIIAGGEEALRRSIEGAEDRSEEAQQDLNSAGIVEGDVVIGIASSGTTPYVLSGLQYGRERGCSTIFLICNPSPLVTVQVDVLIAVEVGQEIITGSTRMKSGTATKMILNMISTATMVRLGKVYGNLMVDLRAVNKKLVDRGTRIISQLTGLEYDAASSLLMDAKKEVKTAVVMHHLQCDYDAARTRLEANDGSLRAILEAGK